jgi:hypothetical protein
MNPLKPNLMKTITIIALSLSLGLMSFTTRPVVSNDHATATPAAASIKWANQQINIGEIPQGKPVTFEFVFTNTGKEPILITDVKASCGCTTPDYSKSPVKPGEKGIVKAVYNAAAVGAFTKNVTVTISNDPTPITLTLSGTVLAAAN